MSKLLAVSAEEGLLAPAVEEASLAVEVDGLGLMSAEAEASGLLVLEIVEV